VIDILNLPPHKLLVLQVLDTLQPREPNTGNLIFHCQNAARGVTFGMWRYHIWWLEKKHLLRSRWKGASRLWSFGPISDLLRDRGILS
jgi:hypothetical protein